MITAKRFSEIVSALPNTTAVPHMDRTAFRTPQRIFVTLAGDGSDANFKLSEVLQEMLVTARPKVFAPVSGGWGRMGWTRCDLAVANEEDLADALAGAHALGAAVAKKKPRKR